MVGCGFVARHHHLPALDAVPGLRPVALADHNPAALARCAAGREVRTHADAAALLADPGIDVVAVCTPPAAHADLTLEALAAGKHVLVEKPLAITAADGARIVDAARAARGVATVGLVYRWHRLNRQVRDLIAAGAVGRVAALHTVATSGTAFDPERAAPWRAEPARGGGVLYELGTHQLDLWRFLLGAEVARVAGSETGAGVSLAGRSTDGTVLSSTLTMVSGDNQEVAAYGSDATLTVRADRYDGLDLVPAGRLPGDPALRLRRGLRLLRQAPRGVGSRRRGGDLALAFQAQWRAFAAAIRGEAPVAVTLEDGLRALELVLSAGARDAVPEAVT